MKEDNSELHEILLEWSVLFGRRTIHDFLQFAHQQHLTMPQINILMRLYYRGAATIADLRQEMYGSRAAATQMIDDMVRSGLVERAEAEHDRRLKVVSLTGEGRQMVERGIAARRKWMEQLAESFTPEQREQIGAAMQAMISAALALEQAGERPSERSSEE